mmetsp:Transcript_36080/g.48814  ORF Transcript_36080/g.48814 Transcript_36080/m.48814 type:complete len:95 (-) Transcript_36080:75-359(-)
MLIGSRGKLFRITAIACGEIPLLAQTNPTILFTKVPARKLLDTLQGTSAPVVVNVLPGKGRSNPTSSSAARRRVTQAHGSANGATVRKPGGSMG